VTVTPGTPLAPEAPRCDSPHGCGKMRERDPDTVVAEDENTQLTLYVCETQGCPFKGVPYQIREHRGYT
jgi:hypothetical protein